MRFLGFTSFEANQRLSSGRAQAKRILKHFDQGDALIAEGKVSAALASYSRARALVQLAVDDDAEKMAERAAAVE